MIETRQLRYFAAVAEELHFTRAAERLNVAQSGLSAQISQLEQNLGVRLFNRQKRSLVSLTQAGELFHAEARLALRQLERTELAGRMAARGEAGRLSVGYVASAVTSAVLTRLLGAFRTGHQAVRMQLHAMETPRQLDQIAEGALDAGIIRPRPHYPDGIKTISVHREILMLGLAATHPLAVRATLEAADLRNENFIAPQFDESAGFAEPLRRLGTKGGFAAEPAIKVGDFITAASMAAAGYGVVLAPQSLQNFCLPDLVFRPLLDFNEQAELVVAFRGNSPSIQAFVAVARQLAAGQ